jgi:flagellar basal-body rod protein FlgF
MDNALYVGLSRQLTLRRELDVVANNIANIDTTGFKLEELMVRTEPAAPARTAGGPKPIKFVLDDGVKRDFTQGALNKTNSPLDIAIEGQGFFKVSTAGGERYTRDGHFTMSPEGKLITATGAAVLDDGGSEILIDPLQGPLTVGRDGTLSQGPLRVGKIGVVNVDDRASLRKDSNNLYRNVSNVTPAQAPDVIVHQGMLEASNVQPIVQITKLIEVNRAYESVSKMMDNNSELTRTAVERLGRVN